MGTEQDAVIGSEGPHLSGKSWESIVEDLECQATGFRHQGASEVEEHAQYDKSHVR